MKEITADFADIRLFIEDKLFRDRLKLPFCSSWAYNGSFGFVMNQAVQGLYRTFIDYSSEKEQKTNKHY